MIKRFFILLLAIVASVGMSWATTTDLASITDNYTAQDGEILTGTLGVNVKISIADGATVTLLNANINGDKTWTTGDYAGLTCLGDATITIVGTNSVSGFSVDNGYPGIYVPSGKTLIINGTGSLTARSSTAEAAGIGAGRTTHCGNIEIQSGKITAIAGGEEGAGIGGAFNADCGNITISGGIVTAVGGDYSAGIGGGKRSSSTNAGHCGNILISGGVVSATSGKQAAAIGGGRGNNNAYKSNCGTITITNTALKVYAEQGGEKGSTNTIGAGKYNNCGTVTIGGNTGVINDDPYTYRTKEDGEIVVVYINAIGTVVYTQECKDKIDIARELYDALEDSQKTLVTNYQVLLDAEAAYAALIPQPAADPIPCTPADLGKVLCTDGSIYATVSEATAASKTAAAVIAYVDTQNGKALALALADDGEMEWATAKTTAAAHTPAVSGGTWTLASKDDWNNMITAAGGYEALRDGFSGVGGTNMQQDAYWSSTPVDDLAWIFYFAYGGKWVDGYVDDPSYVRACLAFDIPAAPAYETVMNLINAIGTVELTAECKAKIDAARAAYDALSDGDKAQVTNIATLTQAETDYAALAAAAAAPVIAQIEALPTTIKLSTYFSTYDLMVAARAAYNALSAEVQAAVTNLSKLTNLEAAFAAIGGANEKLSKPFSVGAGQVVYFAHGNLQATYNGTNWSWAFAAHQYDYIGDTSGNIIINGNGTLSGAGTVDLFGWVANSSTVLTSGVAKYGVSNSDNVIDYGLGTTETLKGDWGVAANDANIGGYNDWRILSNDEWVYLFKTRTDAASKYGYATVGGVNGVIIIPDAFTDPMKNKGNLAFRPQNVDKGYSTNVYTTGGNWEAMEAAGAVFMPAAGRRAGTAVTINEGTGFYWSSTPMSYQASYFMGFMGSNVVPDNDRYRYHGLSVRLVSNNASVASTPLDSALVVKDLIEAIPSTITLEDACVKAINDAREAYNKLSGTAKGLLDEATIAKLTDAEAALTALYQAEADKVIAKINNIPTPVTLKLATRDSIESARAAYEALNADQKLLVTNYDDLVAAEAALAGLNPGGGAPLPEGALTGAFSINAGGDKIAFSKGNLQATYGGSAWTWAFAAHQYDVIGNAVANTAITGSGTVSANGTVDLFGWSTAATYYGINNSNVSGKHPGDFIDWGETIAEGWRTLTRDEWNYLLETRTDAASKYGHATVAGIHGIIVLPDSYKGTAINADHSDWSNNIISAEDWAAYEANGVAFLPAAGSRLATSVNYVGEYAFYWTSTTYGEKWAYRVRFVPELSPDYGDRVPGQSVRLVTAHTGSPTPLDSAQAVKDLIEAIPVPVTLEDACVNAVQAARDAYNALADATKDALDDATVQKLNQAIADYTALIQAGADAVTAKIAAIPQPVDLKLATRDSIESARAAYDALTADQKALVTNYAVLEAAEAALAALNPGGGMPADALNGKFTINAGGDQISFAKGNLQATTEDLGAHWTWGFAANQWNYLGIAVANSKINGNGTVSENGTVDLFGWSTAATYYGINNSDKAVDYIGDFVDWGPKMGAGWRTLTKDEWQYLIENNTKGRATVNDKSGYIFLPNDWSGPAFTPDPDNFTTNVYSGDDWTAMENAGAVFLPSGPARNRTYALIANDAKYSSSTSLNNDTSCVFTIYYNQSQSACTGTNRAYGCMVRLVTEGGGATPLDSAQVVKDLIEAIPAEITLDAACVKAIEDARAAYDALSEATKGALDAATVKKLTDAEAALTALNQAEADKVIAKIALLPNPVQESDLKLSVYDKVLDARTAYDALNAAQQALVTNYQTLLDAEAAFDAIGGGGTLPTGALTGAFSVGKSSAICFSQGNLQATTADLGANWTWSFAANQWDFIGNAVANTAINDIKSVSTNGTVDLFGWSTAATYYGISNNPGAAYYTGDFIDWGTNAISNGGNTANAWHTLAHDEWDYLFNTRTTTSGIRYAKATVNGIPGIILLPDDWSATYYALSNTNDYEVDYNSNDITTSDWTNSLEANGAVFLPAAGERLGADVSAVGSNGHYWSSTFKTEYNAYCLSFNSYDMDASDYINRREGYSVRLVVAAPVNHIAEAQAALALINAIPDSVTLDEACVKAIKDAREAVTALGENASLIDETDMAKLTDAEAALTALNQAEADKVVAKINNIPTPVELKLATLDSIQNARAAYDALNADQKTLVSNYTKLTDAEAELAALNPGVPPATPLDSAQAVKDLIDAIPDSIVYPTSGPAIEAALVAYNQLSDAAKGALDDADVQKLTNAATQYAALEAIAAIENIPDTITYDPLVKAAIENARAKYDTLSTASKALVSPEVLHKLTNAEEAWAILVAKIEHNVSYIGKDSVLHTETVALLHIPDPAPEFNGYEFVRWDVKAGDFLEEGLRIKAVYTPIITTNPVAYDSLMYNGAEQTLITAGEAKEGHIEYRINDGEWSTELPKATFAAAYVVYYKLVREGHADYIADSIVSIIAKAPVVYTAPTAVDSLVYNASNQTLIAAGQTNDGTFEYTLTPTDEQSWKAALPQFMPADTIQVFYRVVGDENHRDSIAPAPVQTIIAKAPLSATADNKTVTYGDPVPQYTVTYAGWQGEDTIYALTGDIQFICEYTDTTSVGDYAIMPIGQTAHDYSINFVPGVLTVNKAESGCLAPVAFDTLVYNGINQTLIIAGQAFGGEMQYSLDTTVADCWSTALPQAKDAATYNVYYRVKGDKNHNDHYYPLIAVTIAKATLTATAEDKTVTYGDPAPAYTVAYTGWKGTDEASVLTGTIAYACTYAPLSNVGEYTITPSGVDAANYNITFVNGKLTVVKAPVAYVAPVANELTYTAAAQELITAGTTNDGQFVYRLGLQGEYAPEIPEAVHVGAYDVYYKVLGDGNHLDSIIATPVAVNIDKAPLTATADNKTIIFGENIPAYSVTYAGWLGNDKDTVLTGAIAYACEYVKGSPVGEYVITPSGVDAADYDITFLTGKVTVNRKSATSDDITAKQADNEMLVYDAAANKPTIQVKDTTKTLIEDTDYKLTFIGRGTTEYAESATAPAHVGDYTAVVAFIGNYKDTLTVDFVINKAPLTITADNKQVTFGEFAPEFTVSYEGWQGTDTATVLTGSQAYTCAYVRGNNVGEYTISPSGVDAHDYAITFIDGTLTVNRKSAKSADIAAKQADNETLVYDAEVNRPTIQVKDTTLVLTETQDYVLTFKGVAADQSTYAESETAPTHVGNYTAVVAFVGNYIDTLTVDFVINKAPLTITADNKEMIYGDEHPAFTVSYNGWQGNDSANVLLGTQAYDCIYAPGSPIGTYVITPKGVDAYDYAITFVDGTLTVNKAHVYVSGAEVHKAKFADGHANAEVTNQGVLNGIKVNDPIAHVTTAAFSSADVAENLTITLFYELTGDAALLNNYYLEPTQEVFTTKGVIIEPFIPNEEHQPEEGEQVEVQEGIDVYAYGYCDGSGYSLKYHLNAGNPDQYKIEFEDSRFTDVDWTNLTTAGKDGTIDIEIPVDMPTGDYSMTVYFRDSRFEWLESQALTVTFHVNLPETYVRPLFDNVIALIDTCHCLSDIQWYWRATSSDPWEPIPGANGYYYHADGKLNGEYFVKAKMNGVDTYTCGQTDMETLYGEGQKAPAAIVKAYPNPVVNATTVTIENSLEWNHNLRIVDLMGSEVLSTTFEGNETSVEMSGYPQGNYMISVDGIVVKVMKK